MQISTKFKDDGLQEVSLNPWEEVCDAVDAELGPSDGKVHIEAVNTAEELLSVLESSPDETVKVAVVSYEDGITGGISPRVDLSNMTFWSDLHLSLVIQGEVQGIMLGVFDILELDEGRARVVSFKPNSNTVMYPGIINAIFNALSDAVDKVDRAGQLYTIQDTTD